MEVTGVEQKKNLVELPMHHFLPPHPLFGQQIYVSSGDVHLSSILNGSFSTFRPDSQILMEILDALKAVCAKIQILEQRVNVLEYDTRNLCMTDVALLNKEMAALKPEVRALQDMIDQDSVIK